MLFVISEEIIPETHSRGNDREATAGVILGFIDPDSPWGKYYERHSPLKELFYPPPPGEVIKILAGVGLEFQEAYQTLFQPPPDISNKEEPRSGFGEGGFVVLKAIKIQ